MRRLGNATEGGALATCSQSQVLLSSAPKLDACLRPGKGLFVRCGIPSPLGCGGHVLEHVTAKSSHRLAPRPHPALITETRHRGPSWCSWGVGEVVGLAMITGLAPCLHLALTDATLATSFAKTRRSVTGARGGWIGGGSYQSAGAEVWTGREMVSKLQRPCYQNLPYPKFL